MMSNVRTRCRLSAQANVSVADVKVQSGGRSQNAVSAQANVSEANVKQRSGGRSQKSALAGRRLPGSGDE